MAFGKRNVRAACPKDKLEFKVFFFFKPWKKIRIAQRAKNLVSDCPGLVDFVLGLVNSVLNLPNRQVIFFDRLK